MTDLIDLLSFPVYRRSSGHQGICHEQDNSTYCFVTCLEEGVSNPYYHEVLLLSNVIILDLALPFSHLLLDSTIIPEIRDSCFLIVFRHLESDERQI